MDIDIKDIITLGNNEDYLVVSKIEYAADNYYYIININDSEDIKFCLEDIYNGYLVDVKDPKIIERLMVLFYKDLKSTVFD